MSFTIIIDIILAFIFILVVYQGFQRGFVRMVLSLVSVLVALAMAFGITSALSRPIARAASPAMERFIINQASRLLPDDEALETIVSTSEKVVSVIKSVLERMDSGETESEDELAEELSPEEALSDIAYSISVGLYGFLLYIVAFALILAILRVLIGRLSFIERIPIVGVLDSSLGMILGVVLGLVVLFIPVALVVTVIPRVLGSGFALPPSIFSGSYILRLLYALYPGK